MVKTGVIIAAVVCCILVVVGTILGVWGSGVACPDFGMDCALSPAPAAGTPASAGTPSGTSRVGTPSGTPASGTPGRTPTAFSGSPASTLGSLGSTPDSSDNTGGTPPSPVNCEMNDWSGWSACSKTCGGGLMNRTRTVKTAPLNGGTACPPSTESSTCNNQECPVDCVVSDWSAFSSCSATCGGGTQTRTRTVTTKPTFNGAACPPLTESQVCNTQGCPVNCVGSWVGCNVTCGTGIDTYTITTPAANGGTACPTADGATKACVLAPCGVDAVGNWEGASTSNPDGWSACSATCGQGTQTRKYKVTVKSAGGGATTPYQDGYQESRACLGLSPCPQPVDCVGSWSEYTGCTKGCGGGTKTRTYTITTASANGGKACPNRTGDVETQPCNTTSCCDPAVYKLGEWADVAGPDGKVAPPFNCDGRAGDGRPYVLQARPVTFPANPNGPATAVDCQILNNQYRYTALGCADREPTAGSCSDSAVAWSSGTTGCTVSPANKDPRGGTCNPLSNPWSLDGCTPTQAETTPTEGTCSVSGIYWNSTDGCKISPATRAATSVSCSAGSWNGAACAISPSTTNPSGGTCSQPHATWGTGGCTSGPAVTGTVTACSSGTFSGGVCNNTTERYCAQRNAKTGGCTSYGTRTTAVGRVGDWTCPAGYTKSATAPTCDPIPATVTSVSGCPSNYTGDASRNTCVAGSGSVTGIDCSQFAGYDADLPNMVCKARAVTTTDLTCPAGYSKNLTNNKCTAVTGTVSTVTGCPTTYNASASSNKCTAKAATISSLTCSNSGFFKANNSSNKCVPYS